MESDRAEQPGGRLWRRMHSQERHPLAPLTRRELPPGPGVYALYMAGAPVYLGKASSLKNRFWGNHMSLHPDLRKAALRRNICESLGIATAAELKSGRRVVDEGELARVAARLREGAVAWVICPSPAAAKNLEDKMLAEWRPPLNKL